MALAQALFSIAFVLIGMSSALSIEKSTHMKFLYTTEEIPTDCPAGNNDPTKTVHLAHESDCDKFYKCDAGKRVVMKCPNKKVQLHFNPRTQTCDYPWNAGCIKLPLPPSSTESSTSSAPSSTESSTSSAPSSTESSTSSAPSSTESSTSSTSSSTESSTPLTPAYPTSCPKEDPLIPIHLPHECVSSKYYLCRNGLEILQRCPTNSVFNPDLHVCACDGLFDC